MKPNKILLILILAAILIVFSTAVLAQNITSLQNLQKITEFNKEQAEFYFKNITFLVAFLAGVLSVMSPCTIAILPAFFSYTFKEKKDLTKMTFVFFIGFAAVFTALGLVAAFLGHSFATFQTSYSYFVTAAGIFLIVFGIMSVFGKGFASFVKPRIKIKHDIPGIIFFGMVYAVGWTACVGPILAGILLIASVVQSYFNAGVLLFFYSLGIFVPLFILSFFFDKYNLINNKWIAGKEFEFMIGRKKIILHTTNLIAGLLLIIVGIILLVYKGTAIINELDPFRSTTLSYDLQRALFSLKYVNIIGLVALAVFLILLYFFIKNKRKANEKR